MRCRGRYPAPFAIAVRKMSLPECESRWLVRLWVSLTYSVRVGPNTPLSEADVQRHRRSLNVGPGAPTRNAGGTVKRSFRHQRTVQFLRSRHCVPRHMIFAHRRISSCIFSQTHRPSSPRRWDGGGQQPIPKDHRRLKGSRYTSMRADPLRAERWRRLGQDRGLLGRVV
jgi:hypothetical protein